MDRFAELDVFIAVAETGAFAKAAQRLNSSPPAVTRRISALEERLGVQLLNRTTRRVSLTEPGMRFLEAARSVMGDLEAAEKDAAGEGTVPTGHLTITASVTFGRSMLTPIVCDFQKAFPSVTVSVLLLDRVVSIVEEGIDVAVRIERMADSTLVARRVGYVRQVLVASPGYLKHQGRPDRPTDLKDHPLLAFTGLLANREWSYFEDGKASRLALKPKFEINDAAACLMAAEADEGIALALSYVVAAAIKAGRLESVLDAYMMPEIPVQIVYPQSRLIAPKVRAFVDFAAPKLKAALSKL